MFQSLCYLGAARFDDPTIEKDVDVIRIEFRQQTLVMGEEENSHFRSLLLNFADT